MCIRYQNNSGAPSSNIHRTSVISILEQVRDVKFYIGCYYLLDVRSRADLIISIAI